MDKLFNLDLHGVDAGADTIRPNGHAAFSMVAGAMA
jgi:hypothetical protein